MRRLCIIETEAHYEVVRNFVLSIIDKAEFTIVTNTYCAENLDSMKSKYVEIYNYETDERKVREIFDDEYDYKLTVTPPSYKFYIKYSKWFIGSDLLVHNMNYWFQPWRSIYFFKKSFPFEMKSLLRFCKYLPELIKRRRKYKKVFGRFLAPSKELYKNYKSFSGLGGYIRLDYNRFQDKVDSGDAATIVIPGTINDFRDYDMVLQVLGKIALEQVKDIKVLLLGRNPKNRSFKKFENEFLSIKTFSSTLLDEEYTRHLRSADIGILPLREEIEHLGILERKGYSNISGGVNDLAYVGIPGLIPSFYPSGNCDNFEMFRDSEDLGEKVLNFLKGGCQKMFRKPNNDVATANNLKLLSDD